MKRIMALALAAAFVSTFCLAGSLKAQRESRPPASERSPAKISENKEGQPVPSQKEYDEKTEKEWRVYIEKLEQQLGELKDRKRDLQNRQRLLRKETFDRCGMSPENVVPSLLDIEKEILSARIDFAARRGGNEALSKQFAEATVIVNRKLEEDEILKNLESLVGDKAEALKTLQGLKKAGDVPTADVRKAEAELREAAIRAASRKEELTKGEGEAGAPKLNMLMRENSLSIVKTEARLAILLEEREKLSATRNWVDDYTDITDSELPRLNRLIDSLSEKIEQEKWSH
jgi:hypothetical protein